jgi:hypothetical protein
MEYAIHSAHLFEGSFDSGIYLGRVGDVGHRIGGCRKRSGEGCTLLFPVAYKKDACAP